MLEEFGLFWNFEEITVHYLASSTQALHLRVTVNNGPKTFCLSCVYAEPTHALRTTLWSEQIQTSSSINMPWVVMGDFNAYYPVMIKKEVVNRTSNL